MTRVQELTVTRSSAKQARPTKAGKAAPPATRKRRDEEYPGGHGEAVLKCNDYRCRVPGCTTWKRGKRSVAVYHGQAGNSDPAKMLTLCLPRHARATRTLYVHNDWPECCGESSILKGTSRALKILRRWRLWQRTRRSSEKWRNCRPQDGRGSGKLRSFL